MANGWGTIISGIGRWAAAVAVGLAALPIGYGVAVGLGAGPVLPGVILLIALGGLVVLGRGGGARRTKSEVDTATWLPGRPAAVERSRILRRRAVEDGRPAACLALELDDLANVARRLGGRDGPALRAIAARLGGILRGDDMVASIGRGRFAVLLHPRAGLDLDAVVQIAERLREEMSQSLVVEGQRLLPSASVGFALSSEVRAGGGAPLLVAAEEALADARQNGPAAIRGYDRNAKMPVVVRDALSEAVEGAIDSGRITPFFQPQVACPDGEVTGFECLARWTDGARRPIAGDDVVAAAENAGAVGRLAERMLFDAMATLSGWDASGVGVPRLSLNLAASELRDPSLVERTRWELDRFDIRPARLVYEIREEAIGDGDAVVLRNLAGLAGLGVAVDLDDFGTASGSIATMRRRHIARIKIDRSFVRGLDHDGEQRAMVAAMMTMARQLGVDTLAEGVETPGERAELGRLGCGHVQGFAVARPMPAVEVPRWLAAHRPGADAASAIRA